MEELYPLVDYLSSLSRIKLSGEEKDLIAGQLKDILGAAQKVQELDTREVPPTTHVLFQWRTREDAPAESLSVEEVLRNVPEREGSLVKVPRIKSFDEQ